MAPVVIGEAVARQRRHWGGAVSLVVLVMALGAIQGPLRSLDLGGWQFAMAS
jgi:hypothetical protein